MIAASLQYMKARTGIRKDKLKELKLAIAIVFAACTSHAKSEKTTL